MASTGWLHRSARDAEEITTIGFGKAAVAFGDIGRDRERRTVPLIRQEAITAGEGLCATANFVGEIDCLLIDEQFFEAERHDQLFRSDR
jgi:hypothetical protein